MITIEQPELEALILERQKSGHFDSVEQTLLDALRKAPPPALAEFPLSGLTGAEIVAAFQRCPVKGFSFGAERFYPLVSDPVEF